MLDGTTEQGVENTKYKEKIMLDFADRLLDYSEKLKGFSEALDAYFRADVPLIHFYKDLGPEYDAWSDQVSAQEPDSEEPDVPLK